MYDTYANKRSIEASVLLSMARQHILPAACKTQNVMGGAISFSPNSSGHQNALNSLSGHVSNAFERAEELEQAIEQIESLESEKERARHAVDVAMPRMAKLRESLDHIESRMDARDFPFVSVEDMIYRKH